MPHCVQSGIVTAACDSCGGRAEKMHQPVFHRGTFCPRCCPACGENAVKSALTPAPLRGVIAAAPLKRREPESEDRGSQWKDDGWGHRPNDPWVHDRDRQQPRPKWVPVRPHWLR
jgi:hypothetical protein